MASVYAEYDVKMPAYALSYLVNDDPSGLENEDDMRQIDKFMKRFYDEAKKAHGHVMVDFSDEEPYFTWRPAFGLACDVVDAKIFIFV